MLAGVLNIPLVTVLLIFVDQNVCRITRNIEKPEQNPWKLPEVISKNVQVFNQQLCLEISSPIDILRNFAYFLQTPLNNYFQTECMN